MIRDLPCNAEPNAFTSPDLDECEINRLAATYCDGCPIRAECYRNAIRDPHAWGVYGGVFFAYGAPRQARRARTGPKRVAA